MYGCWLWNFPSALFWGRFSISLLVYIYISWFTVLIPQKHIFLQLSLYIQEVRFVSTPWLFGNISILALYLIDHLAGCRLWVENNFLKFVHHWLLAVGVANAIIFLYPLCDSFCLVGWFVSVSLFYVAIAVSFHVQLFTPVVLKFTVICFGVSFFLPFAQVIVLNTQ